MKKLIFLLIIGNNIYGMSTSWLDYNNNIYFGGLYTNNHLSISQLGSSNNNGAMVNAGLNTLFINKIYFSVNTNYEFNQKPKITNDRYDLNTKLGYSYQFDKINLIPYFTLGFGNNGAYYSNSNNLNYGLGVISQIKLINNLIGYLDVNYKIQDFDETINQDFNNTEGINSNYKLVNNQTYGFKLGLNYITEEGFYINPVVSYQNYSQTLNNANSFGYSSLTPILEQYQFGVNFGLVL